MRYVCPQGCVVDVGMSRPHPGDCPEGHGRYRYEKELRRTGSLSRASEKKAARKRGAGLKRTRRRETAAEKRARLHFNDTVKSWPCWFRKHRPCEACGGEGTTFLPLESELAGWEVSIDCDVCGGSGEHTCSGRKDAHHLIPKDFIRRMFEAVLPEDQFVAILHNPKIGAPLCRKAHDRIEAGSDRIYWEDLSEECIEYVGSLPDFVLIRLERECPKRPVATAAASPETERTP